MSKHKLTTKILTGLVLGIIFGLILTLFPKEGFRKEFIDDGILFIVGQIFIRAIQMLVVPIVFVSLVNGSASMDDINKFGRVGLRVVIFYLLTTAIAISIALGLASITNPGEGLDMSSLIKSDVEIKQHVPLTKVLINIVPKNPFNSFSSGNMLQIIVFALLVGTTLAIMGNKINAIRELFKQLDILVMKLVDIVMIIAPIGVFCLVAQTFASIGLDAMLPLLKYILTVLAALFIHAIFIYGSVLTFFAKLNPVTFIKKFFSVISVAFSTASSGATIPVSLETVEEELGVNEKIASFTIPLGATINMDGTAIMQGVACIFISQVYDIQLTFASYLTIMLTATLASIGSAGVPGVGLIMLSMVLKSVGLPIEGIALIIGIDRILDMTRTAVNVTGDAVCTCLAAKLENELDEEVFNKL